MEFSTLRAVAKLRGLANVSPNLKAEGFLTPERIRSHVAEACGLKLMWGCERIDAAVMEQLFALADEAELMQKMAAMQSGEVINRIEGVESEERSVLHTAMRAVFEDAPKGAAAAQAAQAAKKELIKLKSFMEKEGRRFKSLIQIGIGGSELGPKALQIAAAAYMEKGKKVFFVSNVDPDDIAHVISQVDLNETLVVTVSKSGSTLETLTNETLARSYFEKAGIDPKNHFVAVTGEGSPMDDPSRYLASFYIWDFVGGSLLKRGTLRSAHCRCCAQGQGARTTSHY
jgi:glucose-6-phosphate isomerase